MHIAKITFLIIHGLSSPNCWQKKIEHGFKEEIINSKINANFYVSKSASKDKKNLENKVQNIKPDLVLLVGSEAYTNNFEYLMQKKIPTIWTSTTEKFKENEGRLGHSAYSTGITDSPEIFNALKILEKLSNKKVHSIGILVGGSDIKKIELAESVREKLKKQSPELNINLKTKEFFGDWKKTFKEMDAKNDVIIPLALPKEEKQNKTLIDLNIANNFLEKYINTPTISPCSLSTEIKSFIGLTVQPKSIGLQAALIAYQHIKKGVALDLLKVEKSRFLEFKINSKILKKMNIRINYGKIPYANIF